MGIKIFSKSEQIKSSLLGAIVKGDFKLGQCMPSDNELMRLTSTSRATVREAVATLVDEGYLERIQGKGTFVIKSFPVEVPIQAGAVGLFAVDLLNLKEKDPFVEELLLGIHDRLFLEGLPVSVCSFKNGEGLAGKAGFHPEGFKKGVILTGNLSSKENAEILRKASVPCVSVGRPDGGLGMPYVDADHFLGGYMAVEMLAALGHKRIAVIDRDFPHALSSENRRRGILKSMADLALHIEETMFINYSDTDVSGGRESVRRLLSRRLGFSAVIVYGEPTMAGAVMELEASGLSVPKDVSVINCMRYSRNYMGLKIIPSAIMQPVRDMGFAAAEMLLKGCQQNESRIFSPSLLEGASCRRLS